MEFWGIEVKPGVPIKFKPEEDHFLHLSQVALGESKKENDKATMYVEVGDQKLCIGTLSTDKFPQIQFDLVFDQEFKLSHTSKTASVFFTGYKVVQPAEGEEMDFESDESEEDVEEIIPATKENGKAEGKDKEQKRPVKIDAAASKPKAGSKDAGKNKKDDVDSEDESDDSDSDDSEDGLSPSEDDDLSLSEDSSEDDEDSDAEEEETPKKPETGKKRAAEIVLKTPASDKKAKTATPSAKKTGEKKGAVHVATPHPAKKAGKTPATTEKSPKSGGSVACKSCSKTFNSEMALQSHSKAKHEAK